MALWGTNNKCLLRRRRQVYPVLNLVWQKELREAAASWTPIPAQKALPARYEWESIVFTPQHPAREPVAFMNGKPWSLVDSIKRTAGWVALGCSHRRRLHLSCYVVRRLILQQRLDAEAIFPPGRQLLLLFCLQILLRIYVIHACLTSRG